MDNRLEAIGRCIDCKAEPMRPTSDGYDCPQCGRTYRFDERRVLLAYPASSRQSAPAFYRTPFYARWMAAWEDMIPNWVIYSKPFYRWFSMSGHRQIAKLLNGFPSSGIIADLGCGPGQLFNLVDPARSIGLDADLHFLHVLKQRFPGVVAVHCDMRNSPLKSASIDLPVSAHTLEHLYFLAESLEEITRILSPRGRFLFTIPTEGGWGWELGRMLVTGPTLRKKYNLDVHRVMDIEHLNDARRVLKFIRLYMNIEKLVYAPFRLPILGINASVTGSAAVLPSGSEFAPAAAR